MIDIRWNNSRLDTFGLRILEYLSTVYKDTISLQDRHLYTSSWCPANLRSRLRISSSDYDQFYPEGFRDSRIQEFAG